MSSNLHISNEWLEKQFEQKRTLKEMAKEINCSVNNISHILFYHIRKQLLRQLRRINSGIQDIHYFNGNVVIEVNDNKLIKHKELRQVKHELKNIGYNCEIVVPCKRC